MGWTGKWYGISGGLRNVQTVRSHRPPLKKNHCIDYEKFFFYFNLNRINKINFSFFILNYYFYYFFFI